MRKSKRKTHVVTWESIQEYKRRTGVKNIMDLPPVQVIHPSRLVSGRIINLGD
jgi:hypothetical protein